MSVTEACEFLNRFTFGGALATLLPAVEIGPAWRDGMISLTVRAFVPERTVGFPMSLQNGMLLTPDALDRASQETLGRLVVKLFCELMSHEARESIRLDGKLIDDPHAQVSR